MNALEPPMVVMVPLLISGWVERCVDEYLNRFLLMSLSLSSPTSLSSRRVGKLERLVSRARRKTRWPSG